MPYTYWIQKTNSNKNPYKNRFTTGSSKCMTKPLSILLKSCLLDQQWLPNQSDFPPISWPWYRAWPSPIMSGFHGAFATGVACQQGTLTTPDTWFRPLLGGLHVLWLLRPVSPTLHRFIDLPKLTFTELRFPWSICDRCGMPAGSAYPSGHLVPSPILGLANAPIVETKFLELAMSLLDSSPRIPLGTFSILLTHIKKRLQK